jgi:hypothetical protein
MKRYYPRGPEGIEMVEDPIGAYVRYEDYDSLQAQFTIVEKEREWAQDRAMRAAHETRLMRAITGAMDALSNGRTEEGARILRECFWLGERR